MTSILQESLVRIKVLATYPAKEATTHTYKSGINKGKVKNINARPASIGLIGVSEKTIWQWVREGKFPTPIKLGGVTVWRSSDIKAWMHNKGLEA
ncbi:helix-turn-helix transcriptional regulator [Acinetobacter guillouiae]|uniref:helix-turn-helix transcriptional regulator n=1 Tax=Acinetobacter guillouiae TaxID=106649 RepID=UPI001AEB3B06|nr:AlpA family phage regulatory protein [Acinetobacter guillouiae]MBP2544344.1 putative DNA-binding transcriptional regulator AlpA [Acinetobacter guillouiae]